MDLNDQVTILIIDDEAAIRQSYADFLDDLDYKTITAENGRIGIDHLKNEKVDLILTDLRMPELDGLEVLRQTRQLYPEIPLIVISGTGVIGDAVEALHLGAWEYLLKPIEDFSVLLHAVTNTLEKARLKNENREYQQHLEGMVADRTKELKDANDHILNLNEELEKKIEERTKELKESLKNLEQTQSQLVRSERLAALGNMVAGVAHEINTPLGISVTEASFLEEQINDLSAVFKSEKLTQSSLEHHIKISGECSASILRNLSRAAKLIESFKLVAVDQTSEENRAFKVKEYVEEALLSLRPKIKRTKHIITIKCDEDLEIVSYPGAFFQIISNLIMNSLIHGFHNIEKGNITFSIEINDDILLFVYKDNGVGMDDRTLKQVFDPFFTTKRNRGGTGLGMQIVYNLVNQKLNGEITCSSSINEGVEFEIKIPMSIR